MPSVIVSNRAEERIHFGHPWIYRSDIVRADAGPGEIVRVLTGRDRVAGHAFYSDRSEIALRLAAALAPFWYYTNALREGVQWFERVLELNPMAAPEWRRTRTPGRWKNWRCWMAPARRSITRLSWQES